MPFKLTVKTTRSGPRLVDAVTFPIECPKCSHKTEQSAARLKDDPVIVCPSCGESFKIESGGSAREVADQLKNIDRLLDNFGKR